jgi:hypothetical protein
MLRIIIAITVFLTACGARDGFDYPDAPTVDAGPPVCASFDGAAGDECGGQSVVMRCDKPIPWHSGSDCVPPGVTQLEDGKTMAKVWCCK